MHFGVLPGVSCRWSWFCVIACMESIKRRSTSQNYLFIGFSGDEVGHTCWRGGGGGRGGEGALNVIGFWPQPDLSSKYINFSHRKMSHPNEKHSLMIYTNNRGRGHSPPYFAPSLYRWTNSPRSAGPPESNASSAALPSASFFR